MPLYEYECTACHKRTEKRQKFSDPEITECPFCGAKLARVLSAPAISFKGGGWYKDGYGSAKPAASSESNSGEGAAPKDGRAGGDKGSKTSASEGAPPVAAATGAATAAPATAPSTAAKS